MPQAKRHFKMIDGRGQEKGYYSASKPYLAAKKVVTQLARKKGSKKQSAGTKYKFSIVECTQGREKKVHNYVGHREKNPVEAQFGKGKNAEFINFEYVSKVKKVKSKK
jgi:hypothetical protein